MFLSWRVTDSLSGVTIEEFNKDYNGLHGFIKFQMDNNSIGFIPEESVPLDGDSDILYYIKKLIECGLAIYKNETIDISLLSYNMLKICVRYDNVVLVDVKKIENNSLVWRGQTTIDKLVDEINSNYCDICKFIEKCNPVLFKTELMQNLLILYRDFHELLSR